MKYWFLMVAFLLINCGDESDPLPSNLELDIQVATDGSGLVTVQATASNAKFYTIFFGEPFETGVEVEEGLATHTYSRRGEYHIIVRAHQSETKYITEDEVIQVDMPIEIPTEGFVSPESYPGLSLVWQDEFDGTMLNSTNWTHETGTGSNGWGNNELQYYQPENTTVDDGYLIITAKKEFRFGSNYTSSRIITKEKRVFKYGRVDIRAALPEGQGIWPALWMLGENISTVGWPKCGEIDIMEMIGGDGREKTVHGTVHWDNNGNYANYGGNKTLESGTFHDNFHVFSITWDETKIRWFVDGTEYHVIDITPAELSEFHNNYFFIFNVAVGGNWPGSPNGTTWFPQDLIVDYIRVFQ